MTAGIRADLLDGPLGDDLAGTALHLARRFHDGATLWCLAPDWEPHAHHVAVEFVHPVIMGKPALPAVALTGAGLREQASISVRPGDVVLAVASAGQPEVADVMLRAQAWGITTIWIGAGPRVPAGAADHVLWIEDDHPAAPATGQFVLLYHLLWELTHVCFEHPGLLKPPPAAECTDDVCITCSDEGRPAEVISPPDGPFGQALVRTATGTEEIDVTLVSPVSIGDLLLVHAGAALTRIGVGS